MSEQGNEETRTSAQTIDDSVEAHKVRDTGELSPSDEDIVSSVDDSVEGHINFRPLDNGSTGQGQLKL
jgi:hypothetical protein